MKQLKLFEGHTQYHDVALIIIAEKMNHEQSNSANRWKLLLICGLNSIFY